MSNDIDILMATYNGASYIEAQINSIIQQSHQNWKLLIRDDGSTDGTIEIVKQFRDPRIQIIPSDKRLGVIGNFSALMQHSKAPYIMFSDQDDVWFPNKIEKTISCLLVQEKKLGNHTPLLVHTDLKVVDRSLQEIDPSFWKFVHLDADQRKELNQLLIQNSVTGCTMLINRSLLTLASPIPEGVCMHDWWVALVASAFGKIDCVKEATMHYRQHGNNTLGAQGYGLINGLRQFWHLEKNGKRLKMRTCKQVQAALFLERYQSQLDQHTRQVLIAFQEYCKGSMFNKWQIMRKYGFYKHGLLRNIYELLS